MYLGAVFDEHHPEMLELSVKRFSVLSTERDVKLGDLAPT